MAFELSRGHVNAGTSRLSPGFPNRAITRSPPAPRPETGAESLLVLEREALFPDVNDYLEMSLLSFDLLEDHHDLLCLSWL